MKVHLNKAFVTRIKCEESKSKQEFNDIQMIGFFLEVRKNKEKFLNLYKSYNRYFGMSNNCFNLYKKGVYFKG